MNNTKYLVFITFFIFCHSPAQIDFYIFLYKKEITSHTAREPPSSWPLLRGFCKLRYINFFMWLFPIFRLFWSAIVVIINGYTGLMGALLKVPKLNPTVNTLDELATSNKYKLTLEKSSILVNQFLVMFSN